MLPPSVMSGLGLWLIVAGYFIDRLLYVKSFDTTQSHNKNTNVLEADDLEILRGAIAVLHLREKQYFL